MITMIQQQLLRNSWGVLLKPQRRIFLRGGGGGADTTPRMLPLYSRSYSTTNDEDEDVDNKGSSKKQTTTTTKTKEGGGSALEWRKHQLEQLSSKFNSSNSQSQSQPKVPSRVIQDDQELQPMWKEMESRVTRRKPRTLRDTGGRIGRMNIRRTDEDIWLQEGLYATTTTTNNNPNNNDTKDNTNKNTKNTAEEDKDDANDDENRER